MTGDTRPNSNSEEVETVGSITNRRLSFLLLGPILLLVVMAIPAPIRFSPEAWNMVGLSLWMMVWWMTETVPVPLTALLPIPMMPLLGITNQKTVAASYGHPLIFLFLGGFLIAAAMQRWGLHRRIALTVVKFAGTSSSRIVAGFMVATAFLSMWISNTATALMMYTVGISLVEFLSHKMEDRERARRFGVALMLGIAYSASIGGVATLIGTPPNTLLASFISDSYGIEIDFATWMMMGVPLTVTLLPIIWALLCKLIFPVDRFNIEGVEDLVQSELDDMGAMSRAEKIVSVVFVLTALLWITRKWLVEMTGLDLTDTSIALLGAGMLFVIPASSDRSGFVIDWEAARKVPWGILLLFGGGLALAGGFKSSGLAPSIGEMVATLNYLDISVIVLITASVIVFLTELTSNTATTATFLPIMGAVSVGLGSNPLVLAIPVALAASMAFMMPVATPPNAIVFSYEGMRIQDMMKAGFWLNLMAIALIYCAMTFLAPLIFHIKLG